MSLFVEKFWAFVDVLIGGFVKLLDKYSVGRRLTLYITLYATTDSYLWAKNFALTSTRTGLEVAAIITAVLTTVTALQGWVFRLYNEARAEEQRGSF